jgi:hypothetical protein
MVANLTVRPPVSRIAEEPNPGILLEANEPRFFTPVVLHLPLQILAVERTPEVGRFARSAKTFSTIMADFLESALKYFQMQHFYMLSVEPIAEKGSFLEWYRNLEHLDQITIHYIGKNLPARPDGLIYSLKSAAGTYQESCPLGVLELRTSMHLTSICALGSSWSWNLRHLIVVYSGG